VRRLWAVLPAAALLLGCGSGDTGSGSGSPPAPAASAGASCQNLTRNSLDQLSSPPVMTIDVNRSYTARITTPKGSFTIALKPKQAPVTVNNFVCLGQGHYYDGLTFHRVVPGFVAQGGDPLGNGTGGPNYKLPNETNRAPWGTGSVGMASSQAGVSGSQFFIVLADGPNAQSLATSGVYNQFGNVTDGMDVVARIAVGDKMTSVEITEQ
jgi:cyclophilin family peptidyl-prolyl cis-trans isomerase